MRVQNINQSSIYKFKSRQEVTANSFQDCCPKPKPSSRMLDNSMPSFKCRVGSKQVKTLVNELYILAENTCNSIKKSFNNSKTKKILIAPIQKKWSDFAYKAPRTANAIKSTAIVTAFVSAIDMEK